MTTSNNEKPPQAKEPAGVVSTTLSKAAHKYIGIAGQTAAADISEAAYNKGTKKNRYRKVEVRTWADEKFRALSPMPASGQSLWFFLMTGPQTSAIAGLFRAGRAGMAEELGWEMEDFDKAFLEVFDKGMAKADFKARLVWLPNALKHNKPESPNVVVSWKSELDLLPECDLKREAASYIRAFVESLGPTYLIAFDEEKAPKKEDTKTSPEPSPKAYPKASDKTSPKPMPNQEQEQEQEREQEETLGAVAPALDSKKITKADYEKPAEKIEAPAAGTGNSPPALGVRDLVAEGVDRQHADDWLKARKTKRAPLTQTAWDDVKSEAAKAGITPAKAVEIAAKNSWQGFKASWAKNAGIETGSNPDAGKPLWETAKEMTL